MWYYEKHPDQWSCLPRLGHKKHSTKIAKNRLLLSQDEYSLMTWGTVEQKIRSGMPHKMSLSEQEKSMAMSVCIGANNFCSGSETGKNLLNRRLSQWYLCSRWLQSNGYTGIAWCFGKHDRPFPPKKHTMDSSVLWPSLAWKEIWCRKIYRKMEVINLSNNPLKTQKIAIITQKLRLIFS